MKSAEEWMQLQEPKALQPAALLVVNRQIIRSIQLDAMKEGARRAANCAISDALMRHHDAEGRCNCGNCSARRAILTTAEQWTEKDLYGT